MDPPSFEWHFNLATIDVFVRSKSSKSDLQRYWKKWPLCRPTSSGTAKLRLTDTDKNIILIVFLAMSISVEFRNTLFVVAHLTKRSNDGLLSLV